MPFGVGGSKSGSLLFKDFSSLSGSCPRLPEVLPISIHRSPAAFKRTLHPAAHRVEESPDRVELTSVAAQIRPPSAPSGVSGPAGVAVDFTLAQLKEKVEGLPVQLFREKKFRVPFSSPWTEAGSQEAALELKSEHPKLRVGPDDEHLQPVESLQDFLALETFLTDASDGPPRSQTMKEWSRQGLKFGNGKELYSAYLDIGWGRKLDLTYQGVSVGDSKTDPATVEARLERLKALPKDDNRQRVAELYCYLVDELDMSPSQAAYHRRETRPFSEADQQRFRQIMVPVEGFTYQQREELFAAAEDALDHPQAVRDCLSRHGLEATRELLKAGASKGALELYAGVKPEMAHWGTLLVGQDPKGRLEFLKGAGPTLGNHPQDLGRVAAAEALERLESGEAAQDLQEELQHRLPPAREYQKAGAAPEVAFFLSSLSKAPDVEVLRQAGILDQSVPGMAAEGLRLLERETPSAVKKILGQRSRFEKGLGSSVLARLSEPLEGTGLDQRLEAAEEMGLLGGQVPELKLAVVDLYRGYVKAGHASQEVAFALEGFTKALAVGREDQRKDPQAGVEAARVAGEKMLVLDAYPRMRELTEQQFHYTRALDFLEQLAHPAGSSSLGQRFSAFKEAGLAGSDQRPFSLYTVKEAILNVYLARLKAGDDPTVAGTQLKGFVEGLRKARKDDLEEEPLLEFLGKATQTQADLRALSHLRELTDEGFHLERALDFLELLSEPAGDTTFFERMSAFRRTGLMGGKKPLTQYVVKEAGLKRLQSSWASGVGYEKAVASVSAVAQLATSQRLSGEQAQAVLELGPIPEDVLKRAYELGSGAHHYLRRVCGKQPRVPHQVRQEVFDGLLQTRRPGQARMSVELAADLYDSWVILVSRAGQNSDEALAAVQQMLKANDQGGDAGKLGQAILETVNLTAQGPAHDTEFGFEDNHVIVGDVGLPVAD